MVYTCMYNIYIYMLTVIYLSKIYTLKFITIKDSYGFLHSYSLYTITFTKLPSLAPTTYKMHFKLHSTADQLFYKLEPTIPSALQNHFEPLIL